MTDQAIFTPAFCVPLSEPVDRNVGALGVFSRGENELCIDQWSPIHNEHTSKPYLMALVTFQIDRAKLVKFLNVRDGSSLDALQQAMVLEGKQHPKALIRHIEECASESWHNEIYSDLPFAEWPDSAELEFKVKLAA